MPKKSPFIVATFSLLLILALLVTGCSKDAQKEAAPTTSAPATGQTVSSEPPPAAEAYVSPREVIVKTALQPSIDPSCLSSNGKFELKSAPIPTSGLEQGSTHIFCVTGVPAGENVTFMLISPDGLQQTFQTPSIQQGNTTVAVQPIVIGADAKPGEWKLIATFQDKRDSISFNVIPATSPFITLAEPVPINPDVVRVSIGGMKPNTQARFAIYRLNPGQPENGIVVSRGELLLESKISVDDFGRADLVLDVTGQPAGPYLLTISPDEATQTNTIIQLPQQERTALAINLQRPEPIPVTNEERGEGPGQEGAQEPASDQRQMPPPPQVVDAKGSLPDSISITVPQAKQPSCQPGATPSVQLWPQSGQVGQWWYGCASGFAPDKPLHVNATLGNGQTVAFDLDKTASDGTKTFRWYSLPSEGHGDFSITISDGVGGKAVWKWRIDAATQPHLLVYPHVILKNMTPKLIMAGFPANAEVRTGIYRLDLPAQPNTAVLVKKFTLTTNPNGVLEQDFQSAGELEPGAYMIMAQSSPVYQFGGISEPATAIEFFSIGTPLPESYEFYSLFVGRTAKPSTEKTESDQAANSTPAPTPNPTPKPNQVVVSAKTDKKGVPVTITIPEDKSAPPTCPKATKGKPSICIMPTTVEQGTYVYMLMRGFKPGTKFAVTVTPPSGRATLFYSLTNKKGIAEGHWYPLSNEKLGKYKVVIRGGGKTFKGSFTVKKATSPHVVVQSRSPVPGANIIVSATGLKPGKVYVLARYRASSVKNGQVNLKLIGTREVKAGKNGGIKVNFTTKRADKGKLFMIVVYEKGSQQPLAQEVYAPGITLYLRYPYAWGGAQ